MTSHPALLPVHDPVALTAALVDLPSVSGEEAAVADAVEALLRTQPHLEVRRDGDAVLARTSLGRAERVVVAGHIDTVPIVTTSRRGWPRRGPATTPTAGPSCGGGGRRT